MEVKILKENKTSMDIEIGSLTIAEVWRREHPTKNPVLHIESDNPKKLLKKAISEIEKETDEVVEEFNKLK